MTFAQSWLWLFILYNVTEPAPQPRMPFKVGEADLGKIRKLDPRLCAHYRKVWRSWESEPTLAPYNKPHLRMERGCKAIGKD